LKRSTIIILVLVTVIILVPVPRTRAYEDLVDTYDCTWDLVDGHSLHGGFVNMEDETKIVIDIESTEDVQVEVKDAVDTFYNELAKIHNATYWRTSASYDITITNPSLLGLGDDAVMSGSIKAYQMGAVGEWLPWWMHYLT
jgi:hypothetical protein